jgi:hypothetical protein
MKNLPMIVIGAAAVVFLSAAATSAQAPVGYVLERRGDWVLNNSATPLSPGQKLPAGGSIRRRSASNDDFITIVDTGRKVFASRNCASDPCRRPIDLPRAAPSRSFLGSLYDAAMETIFGSPVRSDSNLIRSGGLLDGVVEYKDGKISVGAVVKPEGEQYLRWRTVSLSSAGEWSKPARLSTEAIISGLSPGLYEMNLMRSNGSNFEPVGSSWILVTPAADYEKASAAFREMRELTEQWGEKIKPETRRLFLQASLENLARRTPK